MSSSISSSESAARRSLWRSGVLFGLLAFGAVTASEWLIGSYVVPNENFEVHKAIFNGAKVRNVAFGDSQTAFGLTGLPGFVNLANVGEPAPVIEYKIRRYFADHLPDHVILQANPSMFSPHYEEDDVDKMILRYEKDYEFWILERRYYSQIATYWRMFLTGMDFEPNARMLPDGSRTRDRRWANIPVARRQAEAEQGAIFRTPMSEDEILQSRTFASFERSIDFLRDRGAEVCLLNVPVSPELAAAIRQRPQYRSAMTLIERTAREVGVPFVDLHDALPDPENYDDQNHLNPRGARLLSGMVLRSCFGHSMPGSP